MIIAIIKLDEGNHLIGLVKTWIEFDDVSIELL
jgi:hypothetical protein